MCDKVGEISQLEGMFNLKDIKESLAVAESLARTALMTSPAAKRRLMARKLEMGIDFDSEYVPPKQVLLYLVRAELSERMIFFPANFLPNDRITLMYLSLLHFELLVLHLNAEQCKHSRMGSFTSTAKIENPDSADEDLCITFHPASHSELIKRCEKEIESAGRPPLLTRNLRALGERKPKNRPFLRLLQWNILSQTLGVSNDNFVKTPPESLDWSARRFYILQEILQHDPDVICLEEVDHFKFLETALKSVGYIGKFFPKPDSPCVYVDGNNGPDGAALFFRSSKFELISWETRILEVWHVQSNQVGLACLLKHKQTEEELCVAVTHLKAKSGALLATLRDHQGKDLLNWLNEVAGGRPVIIGGDFNAEPSEPLYRTMTNNRLDLRSGYCVNGREPPYTTWKIREEGEICHTIDYIFHSEFFLPVAVLDFPDEQTIGPSRVPSLNYPSDHFSLLIDFEINRREID